VLGDVEEISHITSCETLVGIDTYVPDSSKVSRIYGCQIVSGAAESILLPVLLAEHSVADESMQLTHLTPNPQANQERP